MHHPYLGRPLMHAGYEFYQPFLVRMGRIASDARNPGANVDALAVEVDVAAFRSVGLDCMAGRAFRLVTDEQNVVPLIAEHGLQVIDDATAAAHTTTSDNDGGSSSLGQVVDDALVVAVAVDCDQLFEGQRAAPGFDSLACLLVPERLKGPIGVRESAREGRVEDDWQFRPVGFGVGRFSPHPCPFPSGML